MTQLPDVSCTIKVLENADGARTPDGGAIFSGYATVRYVIVNDSNKTAGPITIVGSLFKDGVRVQPNGQPNVVPAQQITLSPNQVWKAEFPVSETLHTTYYEAKLLADVGNVVREEDEANNVAQTKWSMQSVPR
jgi:hypothetical protein